MVLSASGLIAFFKTTVFALGYISKNSLFPEPLSTEEEKYYIDLYEKGDIEARAILIERNLRLVAHVCKKYSNSNVELDDLISIGTIGLIKGIDSFNSKKGVRIATYVSRCIDNEILMYFRSIKKINAEISLEETIGKDKDDNVVSLKEVIENNDMCIEDKIDLKFKIKKMYKKMKDQLKDRELGIINMRFGLNGDKPKTQEEIAVIYGISRSYVSRIETKVLKQLKLELND